MAIGVVVVVEVEVDTFFWGYRDDFEASSPTLHGVETTICSATTMRSSQQHKITIQNNSSPPSPLAQFARGEEGLLFQVFFIKKEIKLLGLVVLSA